ncbi:DEAD/DEAH box helicase family protein, partial [Acinetobacter baumannii]
MKIFLYDTFDYTLTKAQYERAQVGSRVAISFGRQNLIGIITEKVDLQESFTGHFQLKAISELLDDEPILDEQVLNLLTWSAQYYQFPIGEVMQTALPALLRQGKPMDVLFHLWKIIPCDNAEALLKRSIKQQDAYQILKLHPAGTTENILNLSGVETATLKALQKKGLIDCTLEPHDFSPAPVQLAQMPLTLNDDQKKATQHVLNAQHQYQAFLLDGLTGSGKTEVYLHIMHEVLKQGKQVLVLVPEIGLTPQTISRFKSRFNCDIALLHSGLNDSKRLQAWQQAQTGKASIILGTRSAIYTPLPRLGLIILDLQTEYIQLKYAKAGDIMGLITQGSNNSNGLQHTSGGGTSTSTNLNTGVDSLGNNVGSLLSPRGTITQDDRTNTLIINDTAQSIDQIRKMIDLLDVQVKQVMVEARIVRASTSFTKELGVKWGILSQGIT